MSGRCTRACSVSITSLSSLNRFDARRQCFVDHCLVQRIATTISPDSPSSHIYECLGRAPRQIHLAVEFGNIAASLGRVVRAMKLRNFVEQTKPLWIMAHDP